MLVFQKTPRRVIKHNVGIWSTIKLNSKDGRCEIGNTWFERTIRSLVVGRKNYMFAGSFKSAQHITMFYSCFTLDKINNIDPQAWLKDVLERIRKPKLTEVEYLASQQVENTELGNIY